jgi:signal transduction histidine kinase
MSTRRDRVLAIVAVVVVLAMATAIVAVVLDARNRGRDALVKLQRQQMTQLTRAMDARLTSAFTVLNGILAGPSYHFALKDTADQSRLDTLWKLNPNARTGLFIIDPNGTILVGTLLQKPVGTTVDRPGLSDGLQSASGKITPVGPGVTTSVPTIAFVLPVRDPATKALRGAFVLESDVSVQSDLDKEVSSMGRGRTGEFAFIDTRGTVVASSRADRLARPFPDRKVVGENPGFYTRGHKVVAVADVKSANWQAVFTQRQSEFEGGLGQRIQNAVLLLLLAGLLSGVVVFVMLQRRLRNAREEQRRLAEINRTSEEFISIVSHELRTPVAGVLGFLHTTIDHWDTMSEDGRRHAVERASANARRLHALTRDVLDTTSLETGNLQFDLERIDLRQHISETVSATRDAFPGREVTFTAPDGPIWVQADAIRVEQALVNLLDNAVRNSPAETPIDVELEVRGGLLAIQVLDRGPGLSPELLDRVFERFVRGRTNTVQGTGLGLYITRRIVEAHGGSVAANPRPGGGAMFTIQLPIAASMATTTN